MCSGVITFIFRRLRKAFLIGLNHDIKQLTHSLNDRKRMCPMKDLQIIREEIDEIDGQIVSQSTKFPWANRCWISSARARN